MDNINLKDILTGKLTKVPYIMDMDERYEFTQSLADALAAFQQTEFPDIDDAPDKDWNAITDNFILFMMNEDNAFSTEVVLATLIRVIRIHEVPVCAETDTFMAFYRKYHKWIVSGAMQFPSNKVKTAQDYEKEMFGDEKPSFGGHFTLRDHHVSKAIHDAIEKSNKDQ
jgi:hypothetical protein